jgi:outer membrane protein insertion porin family
MSRELLSLLAEEVEKSCSECLLEYDDAYLTFKWGKDTSQKETPFYKKALVALLPQATAHGKYFRITQQKIPRLTFEKVTARFDLSHIFEKKIIIQDITLSKGVSTGVSSESPTFQFIDHLTSPPKVKKKKNWIIQLKKLVVNDTVFTEDFGSYLLTGEGLSVEVIRKTKESKDSSPKKSDKASLETYFSIHSKTDSLLLARKNAATLDSNDYFKQPLELGQLLLDLDIQDKEMTFKNISLLLNKSAIAMEGIFDSHLKKFRDAQFNAFLTSEDFRASNVVKGSLESNGAIVGNFHNLNLIGSLYQKDPLLFLYKTSPLLKLNSFKSKLGLSIKARNAFFSLDETEGEGDTANIHKDSFFHIDKKNLSSKLSFTIKNIEAPFFAVQNAQVVIDVKPSQDKILTYDYVITTPSVIFYGFPLQNVTATGNFDTQSIAYTINSKELDRKLIELIGSYNFREERFTSNTVKAFTFPLTNLYASNTQLEMSTLSGEASFEGSLNDIKHVTAKGELVTEHSPESSYEHSPVDSTAKNLSASAKEKQKKTSSLLKLSHNLTIKNGILDLAAKASDNSSNAHLTISLLDDKKGTLDLSLNNFKPTQFFAPQSCAQITMKGNYDFTLYTLKQGSGSIALEEGSYGCGDNRIELVAPLSKIEIRNGELKLAHAKLSSNQIQGTPLEVILNGGISLTKGFSLQADGSLPLSSFSDYLKSFDEISGEIDAHVKFLGELASPLFSGSISISNGELTSSNAAVDVSSLNGTLSIVSNLITIDTLRASFNGGSASATGSINLSDPKASRFNAEFSEILFQPDINLSLVSDATLSVKLDDTFRPYITGEIRLKNAEFEKNIDFKTIIKILQEALFINRSIKDFTDNKTLPDIGIDVSVNAPGRLFVYTNWFESELKSKLYVTGTLATPEIEGSVESISGWFGLKNKRFNVVSGILTFTPASKVPLLEILSEATLRNNSGDIYSVILEVEGSIYTPKVTISSDRRLSQRELLSLITTSEDTRGDTSLRNLGIGLEYENFSLLSRDSYFSFNNFLYNITKLDSLSVEPAYNPLTGVLEPSVTAQKKILDKLTIIGQGQFSNSLTRSQLLAEFSLSNFLTLSGGLITLNTRQNPAASVDIRYSPINQSGLEVNFEVEGNYFFERQEILKIARLNDNSRIASNRMESLTELVQDAYKKSGYIEASVSSKCLEQRGEDCIKIMLTIDEGKRYKISELRVQGDSLSMIPDFEKLITFPKKTPATENFLQEMNTKILGALRNEGFLGARVTSLYEKVLTKKNRVDLVVTLRLGSPVSFTFSGAKSFTPKDFIQLLDIYNRKQPFGNNSINILIQKMEKLYRTAGYLHASIRYNKIIDPDSERTNYYIYIDEGEKISVRAVIFRGNTLIPKKEIKRITKNSYRDKYTQIFNPPFVIEEELEDTLRILRRIYSEKGFLAAQIRSKLIDHDESQSVDIEYTIDEGIQSLINSIIINGLPNSFSAPELPAFPCSNDDLDTYRSTLQTALEHTGYVHAQLNTEINGNSAIVTAYPGNPLKIGKISILGLGKTELTTVQKEITFKEHDLWNKDVILETRRRLLKLGLFSSVEIIPERNKELESVRGGIMTEAHRNLVIKLAEKRLTNYSFGGGVNSDLGIHVFGEASDKSIFRDGRTLTFRLDTFYEPTIQEISQGIASFIFTIPKVFNSNYSFSEDLSFQQINNVTQEFDVAKTVLSSFFYNLGDSGLSTSFGSTLSSNNITSVPDDVVLSNLDKGYVRLSNLSASLQYDKRDDPLNPRKGFYLKLDSKLSSEVIASEANYTAAGIRSSWIIPTSFFKDRFSIALNSRLERAFPFGGTREIPITQRYYLGGRATIRGFRENSLGPRGSLGNVIGGDILQANTVQFEYLIYNNILLHTFLDSGNVFLASRQSNLFSQRVSTGLGIQYLSPIGPVSADIGHPLDEKSGEPGLRFHFSIGSNF